MKLIFKNKPLFLKLMFLIVVFSSIMGILSFYYMQEQKKETRLTQITNELNSDTVFIDNYLKSFYRFLFYAYGEDKNSFKKELGFLSEEVISNLKEKKFFKSNGLIIKKDNQIVKIYGENLPEIFHNTLQTDKVTSLKVKNKNYLVQYSKFKPLHFQIIFYYDEDKLDNAIFKENTALFSMIFSAVLSIILILYLFFRYLIIRPIEDITGFMANITQDNYKTVDKNYDTKEFNLITEYFNEMVTTLQKKDEKLKVSFKEIEDRERFYYDLLNSQDTIFLVNNGESIEHVNESFFQFFSDYKDLDEFKAAHPCVCDFFEKESGYIYKFEDENWVTYILNNPHYAHKVKIIKDEQAYIFKISAKQLKYSQKMIVSLNDITDVENEKQKVLALNKTLTEYQQIINISTIVSKTDTKGIITFANDNFCEISKYSSDELIGKPHSIVRDKTVPKEVYKELWATIKSGKIWQGQIRNIDKEGNVYHVKSVVAPLIDNNGNIYEYIALRQDVTGLVNAIQRAQQAEQAKTLFLSNMSHEIRTPLNGILGFTKLLLNSKTLQPKEKKYIDIINSSSETLLQIINDILDLSKIESGKVELEEKVFNPVESFNKAASLFSAKAKEKNINLFVNIDFNLPESIITDEHKLKQIVSNLIGNAIKFTPQDGTIEFDIKVESTQNNSKQVCFYVKDYGIGIAKEKQDLIFQEFSQADNSVTREYGGTGLGLSISSKLVKALGGELKVESELGKGSTFYFCISLKTPQKFNTVKDTLGKLKIAIYGQRESEFSQLEDYLTNLVKKVEHIDNIEKSNDFDVVIVHHLNYTDDIKNKTKAQIILFAKELDEKFGYIPKNFDTSSIFNVLLDCLDKNEKLTAIADTHHNKFQGKVLVAEDNPINQELIKVLLDEKNIQYNIVENGLEALQEYKDNHNIYDIVFMDLNMPEMDGKEASTNILTYEKENSIEHTPIVMLTANAMKDIKDEILGIVDDYITKPIDADELRDILQKYLEKEFEEPSDYDITQSAKKVGIPEAIFKKILDKLFETIDGDLDALKTAIEAENYQDIRATSHKIKGSALTVKFDDIAAIADEMEENAYKEVEINYKSKFLKLKKDIEHIRASLKKG